MAPRGSAPRGSGYIKKRSTGRFVRRSEVVVGNEFADKLNDFGIQIVTVADHLPGYVLADVPVVHADLVTRRFGFRDRLAIGDADFVGAPRTRR